MNKFLIGIFIGILAFFLALPVKTQPVKAASCTFTITYSDGTTAANNQIEIGKSFTLQASIDIGGRLDLFLIGTNIESGKRFHMQGSQSISVTSSQIYESNVPTNNGALLDMGIVGEGSSAAACTSITYTYTPSDQIANCRGNLSVNGNTLTVSAQNCRGKKAVLKYQTYVQESTVWIKDITSNSWSATEDITNVTHDNARLYICEPSNPNCNNLAATVGLQRGPLPPGTCPSFASFNPPEPTSTQPLQIQYFPVSGQNPSQYYVRVNNNGNSNEFTLVEAFGRWVADLGQYSGGTQLEIVLIRRSDDQPCDLKELEMSGPGFGRGRNPCEGGECKTALGNIPTDITGFAGRVLSIAIGIAGGIALILMVIGSIRVLTSSGDQQKLAGGRDTIIAAIAGLLFLIFSVLILRALGLVVGVPFA